VTQRYDVVVVGFGGAGACAAIEAADAGARVLVVERFEGGGATRRSGGIVYLGGGTETQRQAGFEDDAEEMFRYLRQETGGAVDEGLLRDFCEHSRETHQWLVAQGVSFPSRFFAGKTTQPAGEYGLYFSGNEKQRPGRPVPRGHVPGGAGMAGGVLFGVLEEAVARRGIEVRTRTSPTRLLVEEGRVVGLEVRSLGGAARAAHRALAGLGALDRRLRPVIGGLEGAAGRAGEVRAGAVVLCTGGFVFNASMMAEHAPLYAGSMPLGTPGDDGEGIRLGLSVGAATGSMDECTAWRFIYPPESFVSGVLVNALGDRFCDESLYGATICKHVAGQPGGRAYLIADAALFERVRSDLEREERIRDHRLREIFSGEMNALLFRKLNAFLNEHVNRRKAGTLERLESKCGMPAGSLSRTVREYNECVERGEDGRFGKAAEHLHPLSTPPFHAINCDLDNRIFLGPCITLGGLRTDHASGQVLREDGTAVEGLYAAGRTACGVCAGGYVSGLSIADCVFSGRRAGRSAAGSTK
jgi:3-oxo-5alpha-steroid 4-dehydrogenase